MKGRNSYLQIVNNKLLMMLQILCCQTHCLGMKTEVGLKLFLSHLPYSGCKDDKLAAQAIDSGPASCRQLARLGNPQ